MKMLRLFLCLFAMGSMLKPSTDLEKFNVLKREAAALKAELGKEQFEIPNLQHDHNKLYDELRQNYGTLTTMQNYREWIGSAKEASKFPARYKEAQESLDAWEPLKEGSFDNKWDGFSHKLTGANQAHTCLGNARAFLARFDLIKRDASLIQETLWAKKILTDSRYEKRFDNKQDYSQYIRWVLKQAANVRGAFDASGKIDRERFIEIASKYSHYADEVQFADPAQIIGMSQADFDVLKAQVKYVDKEMPLALEKFFSDKSEGEQQEIKAKANALTEEHKKFKNMPLDQNYNFDNYKNDYIQETYTQYLRGRGKDATPQERLAEYIRIKSAVYQKVGVKLSDIPNLPQWASEIVKIPAPSLNTPSSSSLIPGVIRNNLLITGVAGGTGLVGLACAKIYYDYTQQKPVDARGKSVPFKTYLYNELITFDFSKVSTWLKVVGIGAAAAGVGSFVYGKWIKTSAMQA